MLPTMIIALVVLGVFVVMLVGQENDMRTIGVIVSGLAEYRQYQNPKT